MTFFVNLLKKTQNLYSFVFFIEIEILDIFQVTNFDDLNITFNFSYLRGS